LKKIKLAEKYIGDDYPCYVIAEIGNLFKNFEEAKRLIDSAKEIGVDAIKFQTWDAETLTTKKNFFDLNITGHISQYEFHKEIQISEALQMRIVQYAKSNNITIFSAPSHIKDLELLEKMEIPYYKIGSDLACHIPLLKKIAKLNKPIILSTGMCTMEEIHDSVNSILNNGNNQLILLHCVSDYPTKIEESNINAILEMKKEFDLPVGFSDHTIGNMASLSAVAIGANIIERHLKDSRNGSFPDDIYALTKTEFSDLINSIKNIEKARGSGIKEPSKSEKINLLTNRVSIVSMKEIKAGTILDEKMIDVRRPGDGIQPIHFEKILGKKAVVDIPKEMPIKWNMIE
jgi:N,N'-diacetyllegionaminate synthase